MGKKKKRFLTNTHLNLSQIYKKTSRLNSRFVYQINWKANNWYVCSLCVFSVSLCVCLCTDFCVVRLRPMLSFTLSVYQICELLLLSYIQ